MYAIFLKSCYFSLIINHCIAKQVKKYWNQFEHDNEHQSILCTTWTSISVVYFGGQRLRLPRRESQATSLVLCS